MDMLNKKAQELSERERFVLGSVHRKCIADFTPPSCSLFRKVLMEADDTAEYFDSDEEMKEKAERLAELILTNKRVVAFTGAGISTAAGIGV